ncbi:histone-fold-containing protein [Scheffersomyces coipomensis]|uniref:histone-fold-containing protein n=1 Tax=Scheffersomyces coipomensis TaxID=1788519 RepID=UPI00315D1F42
MDPNSINTQDVELREQDRWLPIANVARLMKNTLPTTAKVSKDAKECMQECVSEFISFITSEASDKCLREKRKTINGEDILYSMHDLGFENYAEVLKIYLAKYREQQAIRQERGETRASKRQAKQAAAAAAASGDSPEESLKSNEIIDSNSYSNAASNTDTPLTGEHPEEIGEESQYMEEQLDPESQDGFINEEHIIHGVVAPEEQSNIEAETTEATANGDSPALFSQFEGTDVKVKQESEDLHHNGNESNNIPGSKEDIEDYRYDDFITDEPNDDLHLHTGSKGHPNIDELTKQLTHDEPDIDTIAAGIANGGSDSYF